MSRRNLAIIMLTTLAAAVCVARAGRNPYGRYVTQVLEAVDQWALERVPQHTLFDGAMRGIVDQLDEYSSYISSRDRPQFEADLEQEFGGIGVVIQQEGKEKHLTVVSPPLYGTPALAAGVRVRDRIVKIDHVPTAGMTMEEVIRRMRGRKGEPIELTVLHDGDDKPVTVRIVRDTISVPSVLGDVRRRDGSWDYHLAGDPRMGYIRITSFGEKTIEELETALESVRRSSIQGLILDLRDNAGGLLPVAVATCDLFLPKGRVIVSIRGRHPGLEDVRESTGRGLFLGVPMVVLVNRYSASASEIVAACLQDHDRATIVGERTWGKGTVQHVIPIEAGRSLLKLTAATYWRPSGKNIHRLGDDPEGDWGVLPEPKWRVPLSDDARAAIREERIRRDSRFGPVERPAASDVLDDPQLQRARQCLEWLLAGTQPPGE